MKRRTTNPGAASALLSLGAILLGVIAAACNPSPHIDPPGTTAGTGAAAGAGGSSSGATAGSGGTTTTSPSSGGAGGAGGCASNAECSFPKNLCDAASGKCVECLVTSDCSSKPGTVCSKSACTCPVDGQTFCPKDGYGEARCVDFTSSGSDCGACGHACFGSCMASACVDAWEPVSKVGAPSPRARHVAVWTGSVMIVWGGANGGNYLGDGAMYDPDKRTWTKMSDTNAPAPRDGATAVWDGKQMIVWGGHNGDGPLGQGATFDPVANMWTTLSMAGNPTPRYQHTAVWSGTPTTRMILWGGYDGSSELSSGGYYLSPTWFDLNAASPPSPRRLHTAVWDDANGRMIVFGGLGPDPNNGMPTSLNTGGIYGPLPGNEAWTDLGQIGSPPAPRYEHTAVFAGTYMVVWGGINQSGLLDDGARFNAAGNNEWSAMNGTGPSARRLHTAIFYKAASRMIVWGGYGPGNTPLADGGVFDTSAGGQWVPTGVPKGPDASAEHTAVLAGSRMIVWGGITGGGGATNKGAVLDLTKVQ